MVLRGETKEVWTSQFKKKAEGYVFKVCILKVVYKMSAGTLIFTHTVLHFI